MTKMSHQNGNYPVSAGSLSEFSCVYSRSALPQGSFVTLKKSCKICWKPALLSCSYFEAEALTLGLCLSYVAAVSIPDHVPHWSPDVTFWLGSRPASLLWSHLAVWTVGWIRYLWWTRSALLWVLGDCIVHQRLLPAFLSPLAHLLF